MVDIAQLVSASDCGSEGRGFESHYPPQKQKPRLLPWFFVFGNKWIMGFERPLRKHADGMFLGRGRIPGKPTASRKGCWRLSIFWCVQPKRCALYQLVVPMPEKRKDTIRYPFFFICVNGIRKAVKKTCRWHILGRGRIPLSTPEQNRHSIHMTLASGRLLRYYRCIPILAGEIP